MTIRLALLLLALIVPVSLPRFNRNDWLIGDVTGGETLLDNDVGHYVSVVEIYRGDPPLLQPDAPFTYRPLAPWLASFLPLLALTALNVVNLLAQFCAPIPIDCPPLCGHESGSRSPLPVSPGALSVIFSMLFSRRSFLPNRVGMGFGRD